VLISLLKNVLCINVHIVKVLVFFENLSPNERFSNILKSGSYLTEKTLHFYYKYQYVDVL
jgi:hypothetical protein